MNRAYRLVWNERQQAWVPAPEYARGRGKSGGLRTLAAAMALISGSAFALPTGSQVNAGQGSVSQSGSTLTVNQQSQKLSLNWNSFSIGANETVNFVQPSASAIALNRVLGSDPSQIYGHLNANGQVFLINPNGLLFGQGAQVNVGGLVASTLNITDKDFAAGNDHFSGTAGSVTNQGSIKAADGGYVALLGGQVSNQGSIVAKLGNVTAAAGSDITLDFNGDGLLSVQVNAGTLKALADNKGLIQADGGHVLLTAKAANTLASAVVNNTGVIEAQIVSTKSGVIELLADAESGTVNVGGTLDASGGGKIETSGANFNLAAGASVTAGQGGEWLIDPVDLTIDATAAAVISSSLNSGNSVIEQTTATSASGSGTLASGKGDINVNAAISWNSAGSLTLSAYNSINVAAAITDAGSGGLTLLTNNLSGGSNRLGSLNFTTGSVQFTGSGSTLNINGSHYNLIQSMSQLQALYSTSGFYALATNLDASGVNFSPLTPNLYGGTIVSSGFGGTFNGLGNRISNLTISPSNQSYVGLFGVNTGTIANLNLVNATVTGSNYVGGLAGYNGGTLINDSFSGTVNGTTYTGGLVGSNYGSISGSTVTVNVNAGDSAQYVGGIAGYGAGGSSVLGIFNSSVNTTITAGTGSTNLGGVIGQSQEPLTGDQASGSINAGSGSRNIGGLAGQISTSLGVISNSYASVSLTGSYGLGGLTGANSGTITNSHYDVDQVTFNGSHVLTQGGLYDSQYQDWLSHGETLAIANYSSSLAYNSTSGSYVISSAQGLRDLLGFADNTALKFALGASIDLSAYAGLYIPYFSGSQFAGNGYSINNLNLNLPGQNNLGLFGTLKTAGSVSGLTLNNAIVTGYNDVGGLAGQIVSGSLSGDTVNATVSGNLAVGGVAGNTTGSLSNVSVSGAVTGSQYVGGLAGNSNATLTSDSSAATVTGLVGSRAVGGLVGYNNGTISASYATGAVSAGTNAGFIGGLIGQNNTNVSGSWASGSVSADTGNYVGGLIGNNLGTLGTSYATGPVTGSLLVGGLVGFSSGTLNSAYYDIDTVTINGSHQVTQGGLYDSQYQDWLSHGLSLNIANYASSLAYNSSSGSYVISSAQGLRDLLGFADSAGLKFSLGANIDLSTNPGFYIPYFAATQFAGNGYTIANLSANYPIEQDVGFIGLLKSGSTVSGLKLSNEQVSAYVYAGGVAGYNNGTISTSSTSGSVTAVAESGGVAGYNAGSLTADSSSAIVGGNGSRTAGGLVGENAGTATGDFATGAVTGSSWVGGLIGSNDAGAIAGNDYATGAVTGSTSGSVPGYGSYIGGLIGNNSGSTVNGSYATGTVDGLAGSSYVGGLMGANANGNLTGDYATGNVSGGQFVGGLLGSNSAAASGQGALTNVYANGYVSGSSSVGGLVGWNNSATVQYAYANGAVSGSQYVGGLIGQNQTSSASLQASLSNVYASGAVSGDSSSFYVGGLVGFNNGTGTYSTSVADAYASGAVTGGSNVGGLVGGSTGASTVLSSYWDTQSSGQATSAGGTGLSDSQMYQQASFNGFSIAGNSSVWRIYQGDTMPLLSAFMTPLTISASNVTEVYNATAVGLSNVSYSSPAAAGSANLFGIATPYGNVSKNNVGNYSANIWSNQQGYNITLSGGNLTVTPATLTLASLGAGDKVYDSTSAASATGTLAGVFAGDSVSNTLTANFSDKNVGAGKTVTVGGITLGGADAGNYVIASGETTTASITPATLTLSGLSAGSKVYDSTTVASATGTLAGVFAGDNISNSLSASFSDKNVGAGKTVTVGGITLGGTDAGNYVIAGSGQTTTANITPATLTLGSLSASDKIYDSTTFANATGTLAGVYAGDNVSNTLSASFSDKNVGAGKTVTVGGITLNGTDAGNYVIASGETTTASINAATLTLGSLSASDKIYDSTTFANATGTLAGVYAGDNVGNTLSASFSDKNVGAGKTVTVDGITLCGSDAGNYVIAGGETTTATIIAATLTASLTGTVSKVYNGNTTATLAAGNYTLGGVLGGDMVSLNNPTTGTYASKSVGTGIGVTVAGLAVSGADAANYVLVSSSASGNIGSITPKALALASLSASNKVYNGDTVASATGTLSGVVSGDNVTDALTAAFSDKNVGTSKTVTVSGITLGGTDAGNYSIASGQTTTANITPATLTAGLTGSVSKVYNGNTTATLAAANYTLGGVFAGDSVSLNNPTTGTYASKNVGTGIGVSVTGLTISGTGSSNYVLASSSTSGNVGVITPKALTLATLSASNKTYDATTTASATGTLSGVLSGDTVTDVLAATFNTKNVGTGKTVTVNGITLSGASAGNYSIASGQTTTANVTAKSLTIGTLTGVNKVYDGTTNATATGALTGAIAGDSVSAALTGTFASKNVTTADKITIKTQALAGTDAGNYTVSNSVVNQTTTANITPKALALTSLTAANKVYNATTAATVSATLSGVISGDTVTDTLVAAFSDKNAGIGKTVTVTTATLGGTSAGNYTLANGETTTANITPAALKITANNKTISYTGTAFSGGNGVTYSGFVGSETAAVLNGLLAYSGSSQGAIAKGTYVITPGGLSSSNYTITFVNGQLVIGP